MDRWNGKTAVVTGASAGIGASMALTLADAGMIVIAASRRLDKLQDLEKKCKGKGRIIPCRCDMSNECDVINLIEFTKRNAGGVDVLINNAAVLPTGTITDCKGKGTSLKDIEDCFKTNVLGVITATRLAAIDMMMRKVNGYIIMINSIAGHKVVGMGSLSEVSVYGTTKFAITQLVESIRLEFSFTGAPIRITSISPGAVDTALLRSIPNIPADSMTMLNSEDIANAVIYVLSTRNNVNISEIRIQAVGEVF